MEFLRKYGFSEKEIEQIKEVGLNCESSDIIFQNMHLYKENICSSIELLLLLGVTLDAIKRILMWDIVVLISGCNGLINVLGAEEDIKECINDLNNNTGIESFYNIYASYEPRKIQENGLMEFLSNYGISQNVILAAKNIKSDLFMYKESISTSIKFLHSIGINKERMEEQFFEDPTMFTYGVEGLIRALSSEDISAYVRDVNEGIIKLDYYINQYKSRYIPDKGALI